MMDTLRKYGIFEIVRLTYFKFRSFFIFKNAKLIRFPIRIRGKKNILVGKGFVSGFNCRIDAFGSNNFDTIIKIGTNVQINDNVHIGAIKGIEIGDNVLIASKVFITDHNHGKYTGDIQDSPYTTPQSRPLVSERVIIEKNVWIGEYVSILPGVTIGKGSIVGAMSLVNKNIPPKSIAVGIPARVIKEYNDLTKKWEKV